MRLIRLVLSLTFAVLLFVVAAKGMQMMDGKLVDLEAHRPIAGFEDMSSASQWAMQALALLREVTGQAETSAMAEQAKPARKTTIDSGLPAIGITRLPKDSDVQRLSKDLGNRLQGKPLSQPIVNMASPTGPSLQFKKARLRE
jgi:hypothetical protein